MILIEEAVDAVTHVSQPKSKNPFGSDEEDSFELLN